ncbi:MAG TPA: glutaredoxin family protein [Anaerolineae bacterium]|nr:glutaredoxin family protein [Anaerolineae bacterium]
MNVKLYALSTCGWCKKTRQLLDTNGVEYDLVYVDLLEGDEREAVLAEVRKWNPRTSFPTVVVNESESVAGFNEERLRELLGI